MPYQDAASMECYTYYSHAHEVPVSLLQTGRNCLRRSHSRPNSSASSAFHCPEMARTRSSSVLSWAPRSRFISWHGELMCFPSRHTNHRCEVCGLPNIPNRALAPRQLSQASWGAFIYEHVWTNPPRCGSLGRREHPGSVWVRISACGSTAVKVSRLWIDSGTEPNSECCVFRVLCCFSWCEQTKMNGIQVLWRDTQIF